MSSNSEIDVELEYCDFLDYSSNLDVCHPVKSTGKLDLMKHQISLVEDFLAYNHYITASARQMGITTLMLALCHWFANSNPNVNVAYCSHDCNMLSATKLVFENFDHSLRFVKNNRYESCLSNGSQIFFKAFNSTNFVGRRLDLLMIDNAAYINNAKSAWSATKYCLTKDARVWVNSTPKGTNNWFYDTWNFDTFFMSAKIPWQAHEDRDEMWYEQNKLFMPLTYRQELNAEFI